MEDSDSIHKTDLFTSVDCKYEIPEDSNETVLMNLGKEVQMETFKTNIAPEEQHEEGMSQNNGENNHIVILCVGTITGKDSVFIKDHSRRTPPKGSTSPTVCVDIHLKKIKSPKSEVNALSVIGPDPEGYTGFSFKSCHGALIFWAPEQPSSLIEAVKWRKSVAEFAKSRVPYVLVAFNSSNLEWMGKGKMIESEAALKQFCRDHSLVTWFEMKSHGWDSDTFEEALTCLLEKIKTGQT